jgi:hypothetical protein
VTQPQQVGTSSGRRTEMIAEGTLEPRRHDDVTEWAPEARPVGEASAPTLSVLLLAMREQEHT